MSDKDTHTYLEVNGDFRMRELDHNDLEQFNALLQYAFQVTSYELFQTGWEQEEIKYAKRPILEDAYVLGWFYKEKLASMIVVYSMQINIQDNIMAMGGITGVTTYPEYTGRGLIHSLMRYVIDYMHKKKLPISFLYPYSIPFYRKNGLGDRVRQTHLHCQGYAASKGLPRPGHGRTCQPGFRGFS